MPEFISKLQYKTYEKGEYADEMVRPLNDTLELIRNFPWDEQRGSDIQLTGPSVTIQNEYAEYLKVGLYFNGKFCLYFYDRNDHLFELHEPTLAEACKVVSDFFNEADIVPAFEKHLFSVGSKSHFESRVFEYTVNAAAFYLQISSLVILSGFMMFCALFPFYLKGAPIMLLPVFFTFSLFSFFATYVFASVYLKSKNMHLNLSRGINTFQFDNGAGEARTYNKGDITKIDLYGGRSSKGSAMFALMEIFFKDNTSICIPGLLMDTFESVSKFPGTPINYIIKTYPIYKKLLSFNPAR